MDAILDVLTDLARDASVQRGLLLVGIKSALILALAALAATLLRDASAARRHLVWSTALAATLLLPVLEFAVPAWQVDLLEAEAPAVLAPAGAGVDAPATLIAPPGSWTGEPVAAAAPPAPPEAPLPSGTGEPWAFEAGAAPYPSSPLGWLVALWAAGALAVAAYFGTGLLAMHRRAGRGEPIRDERLRQLTRDVMWELDVTRSVALRWTDDAFTPLTYGILRPVILLPRLAADWNEERLRVVLLHELAHIQRHDALTQTIAQFACALFWFNPLAWWGAHRLRVERERACDDYVLSRGTRASAYASHLLEIARTLRARTPMGVVSMAHRGELEGRLLAILEPERRREVIGRARAGAAAVLAALLLLPLAAFEPWDVRPLSVMAAVAPVAPPPGNLAHPLVPDPPAPPPALAGEAAHGKRVVQTFKVRPGGLLDLATDLGSISVQPGRNDLVEVEATYDIEDFDVSFDQRGERIVVRGRRTGPEDRRGKRNEKVHFRVLVPSRFDADLNTSGGSIRVGDLEGAVQLRTSGGSLDLGSIRGRVRGHTSGGSISLHGTTGDVEVETSGGSIRLGDVGGSVRAQTSGGSISVDEVGGAIVASTSGGSITARITKQPRDKCVLETSGGSIHVGLAEGIDLDLDARASGGRVESAFHPARGDDRGGRDSEALRGQIGRGGPLLQLRTSAGAIRVDRLGARSSQTGAAAGSASGHAPAAAWSYNYASPGGLDADAQVDVRFDGLGEPLGALVMQAIEEAFRALEEVDWETSFAEARASMDEEQLAELEEALEEARHELEEARRELEEVHVNKENLRHELDEALREAERTLEEARREREALRRSRP